MKTAAELKKYYKERTESLEKILEQPDKIVSPEDFHKLRVEIKKLKAVLTLVNSTEKNFKRKKFLKPYKKLFKQAGKVRDLQLKEAALKKFDLHGSIDKYAAGLKKECEEEQEKFFALLHRKGTEYLEKNFDDISSFLDEINKKKVEDFEKKKTKKLAREFEKNLEPEQVHKMRKKVKSLFYITKLFPSKNGEHKNLESFQELLGNWHDEVVLEQDLQKALNSTTLPRKEQQQVQKLRRNVHAKGSRLFKKIISKGGSFQNGKSN